MDADKTERKSWKNKFGGNSKFKGDVVEQLFIARAMQEGYYCLKNVSSVGPIDCCIHNDITYHFVDVKSINSVSRPLTKEKLLKLLTTEQQEMGVKIGYYNNGRSYIVVPGKKILKI